MKKVVLALIFVLFLIGCREKTTENFYQEAINCELPYIFGEDGCCLDRDNSSICDSKEITYVKEPEETIVEEQIVEEEKETGTFCMENFIKLNETTACSKNYTDMYVCRFDENFFSNTTCPYGTKLLNYYGRFETSQEYSCFVPQTSNDINAPAGCPMNLSNVSCVSGFVWDLGKSHVEWYGTGNSWGCQYTCRADPNPYEANVSWPCGRSKHVAVDGSGYDTCCAKLEE